MISNHGPQLRREIQCDICGTALRQSIENKKIMNKLIITEGIAKYDLTCCNCGAGIIEGEKTFAITFDKSDDWTELYLKTK